MKKIQEKYTEKGFYLAEVTSRLEDKPDNQVVVVFVVNERAKVQVRRVHFVGNEHVPKDEILPYMQTQEGSFLAFLSSAGTYKEDAFQRDLQAIQAVYLEKGYVNVKVGKPAIALSPGPQPRSSSASPSTKGEQYTIGKVDFSGRAPGDAALPAPAAPVHARASSSSAPRSATTSSRWPTSTRTWGTPTSTSTR